MSEAILVDALEQLKPFLNDKKVLEIVVRGKNKRIAAFQKVLLNDLPQVQEKAALEEAVKLLNKNTLLNERNLKLVGEVANLQKIGLLLNGLKSLVKNGKNIGAILLFTSLEKTLSTTTQSSGQVY